jgi:hypothetical protein
MKSVNKFEMMLVTSLGQAFVHDVPGQTCSKLVALRAGKKTNLALGVVFKGLVHRTAKKPQLNQTELQKVGPSVAVRASRDGRTAPIWLRLPPIPQHISCSCTDFILIQEPTKVGSNQLQPALAHKVSTY